MANDEEDKVDLIEIPQLCDPCCCSTQPYACVDQEGQSRTRLNVLHADAVPRHRPSDDQLARIDDEYCSQSASIIIEY